MFEKILSVAQEDEEWPVDADEGRWSRDELLAERKQFRKRQSLEAPKVRHLILNETSVPLIETSEALNEAAFAPIVQLLTIDEPGP